MRMTEVDRRLAAGLLAVSSLAALFAFGLWWSRDTLTLAYDYGWLAPAVGVTAVIGLWRSAGDSTLIPSVRGRWALGVLTAITTCGAVRFALTYVGGLFVGKELSRTTTRASNGVEIAHIVVQLGVGPNSCQFLDLSRGDGLRARHRVATTCAETDAGLWQIVVSGDEVVVWEQLRRPDSGDRFACNFRINARSLRLIEQAGDTRCRALIT